MIDVPKQNTPVMDSETPALMSKPWWIALKNWVQAFNTLASSNFVYMVSSTQTGLAALALTLTTGDAGLLVDVTDYAHVLRWDGSAFTWGPGEMGSAMLMLFEHDPGIGWHLYDGTANVPYLKSDGTLGTQTLEDLTSAANKAAYLKAGSPNAAAVAAVAPTFTGTLVTPTGTVSAIAAGSGTVNVLASSVTSVSTAAHTHPAPTVTINSITPAGTISANGEPRQITRRPWFRQ